MRASIIAIEVEAKNKAEKEVDHLKSIVNMKNEELKDIRREMKSIRQSHSALIKDKQDSLDSSSRHVVKDVRSSETQTDIIPGPVDLSRSSARDSDRRLMYLCTEMVPHLCALVTALSHRDEDTCATITQPQRRQQPPPAEWAHLVKEQRAQMHKYYLLPAGDQSVCRPACTRSIENGHSDAFEQGVAATSRLLTGFVGTLREVEKRYSPPRNLLASLVLDLCDICRSLLELSTESRTLDSLAVGLLLMVGLLRLLESCEVGNLQSRRKRKRGGDAGVRVDSFSFTYSSLYQWECLNRICVRHMADILADAYRTGVLLSHKVILAAVSDTITCVCEVGLHSVVQLLTTDPKTSILSDALLCDCELLSPAHKSRVLRSFGALLASDKRLFLAITKGTPMTSGKATGPTLVALLESICRARILSVHSVNLLVQILGVFFTLIDSHGMCALDFLCGTQSCTGSSVPNEAVAVIVITCFRCLNVLEETSPCGRVSRAQHLINSQLTEAVRMSCRLLLKMEETLAVDTSLKEVVASTSCTELIDTVLFRAYCHRLPHMASRFPEFKVLMEVFGD
eukprot:CAMPEP_0185021176 /NCGR_PEP_ID=MMETSP1103-20130426/3853_1 /TAXON_ID=36769 /ORGANISM="Paraphysomonas bandaiensis, Strain Caron Lab Isolate" /LENGTH=568 /DNA_ID=CAMNT_0027552541 /DNA_START=194 /DNA_END=1900 /DNA_ORIENTATION=+